MRKFRILSLLLLVCLAGCGEAALPGETTTLPPLNADALLREADVEHHDCSVLGHVFSMADCQHPATCYYCGETQGEKGTHDFTHATCLQKATCTVCGLEKGSFAAHLYTNASCAGPASCAVCGQTTGSADAHNFLAATCVSPARCSVCMRTQGAALGHQWTGGSCTESKTCSRCKRKLPAPGHKMTKGSCTEDSVCTVCGYTVKAPGHKFADGICTVCGQTKAEASRADVSRAEASRAALSETQTETTEPPIDTDILLQYGETMQQRLQSAHDTADRAIDSAADTRQDLLLQAVADLGSVLETAEEAQQFCKADARLKPLQTPLDNIRKAIRKSAAISTIHEADAVKNATTIRADSTAGLKALETYFKAVRAL